MQRSLNDFVAKNRNETVKRKHDSNSNNVTNVSEPVPTPAKKPKWPKNLKHQNITVQIMHSKQQIEILFHMLKKKNIQKTGHVK